MTGSAAMAEVQRYGSLTHDSGLPNVLFMVGEIRDGDSFELRRAMRDQTIDLVVTASPGGSVYEGLQMAAIIHDNEIGTYVPESVSCESSCANVFLGGFRRMVVGDLGVHQFYSSGAGSEVSEPKALTTAKIQYTTSDIIGIMNQFATPPFVYEKMFGTVEIYYFKVSEKPRLNNNVEDETFLDRLAAVDAFIAGNPSIVARKPVDQVPSGMAAAPTRTPGSDGTVAPSQPATVEWERMAGVDFFGMDIWPTGHRNVGIDQCDSICRSDPNCAAWSYVVETRWCWPKSGVSNISIAAGTISMVVNGRRIAPGILDRPFLEVTGKDILGYDIFPKGLKDTTLEQCRAACEFSSSCRAFTWLTKKNWCFPKFGVATLRDQLGVISGVKRDGEP